ncbi:MAG: ATP synthase F0 subunit B [Thermodesulfovibrionales bacterium]|jgi:F-type H+-transporting ATPase subunit b
MLELNWWFFVLLLNFLALIFILNGILFQPMLRLFQNREDSLQGALKAAKEMQAKKEEALLLMNRELQQARNRAKEIFESLRKEGMSRQKEVLDAANKDAHDLIGKAKEELKAEAETARKRLRSDVEKFSDEIVRKMVGV